MRKFHNRKIKVDGMVFDSMKEAERWHLLNQQQRDGKITGLRRQVQFELIPKQTENVFVRNKEIRTYLVFSSRFCGHYFDNKKEAVTFAKSVGKTAKDITTQCRTIPQYKQRTIEKAAHYTADFVYFRDGEMVVEDVKSKITRAEADYVLRRKLMLANLHIKIKEIV